MLTSSHPSQRRRRVSKWAFLLLSQRFPQGPRTNRDFSGSRSQVIWSDWVQLWRPPSAGRLYNGAAARLFSWFCVFMESTPSVGSLRFLFGWKSELSFLSFGPDQWLTLHLLMFGPFFPCLSIILVLFPPSPFRHHRNQFASTLFVICAALCSRFKVPFKCQGRKSAVRENLS